MNLPNISMRFSTGACRTPRTPVASFSGTVGLPLPCPTHRKSSLPGRGLKKINIICENIGFPEVLANLCGEALQSAGLAAGLGLP